MYIIYIHLLTDSHHSIKCVNGVSQSIRMAAGLRLCGCAGGRPVFWSAERVFGKLMAKLVMNGVWFFGEGL